MVRPRPLPTGLPMWLVVDWSRVVRDPLDLLRAVPLIGAVVTVLVGETAHTAELLGAFLLVLAPRVLNVQRPFDLVFQLGMNLAVWGNVLALFDHVYGYDKVVHFMLPCGTALLLYITLCHLRVVPDLSEDAGLHDRVAMVLVTLAFGLTVGGIFEMWEWFSNTVFGTEMFVTYGDSVGDLIDDLLGALAGGMILLLWTGRGWSTWRTPGAVLRGVEPMPTGPPDRGADRLARFGDALAACGRRAGMRTSARARTRCCRASRPASGSPCSPAPARSRARSTRSSRWPCRSRRGARWWAPTPSPATRRSPAR